MNCPGKDLLAHAGLSRDQKGQIGVGIVRNRLLDLPNGTGLSNDPIQRLYTVSEGLQFGLVLLIFQSDVLELLIEAGHLKDVAHCRSSQNADTLAVLTDRDAVADQRDLAFCHMVVEGHDGPHFGLTRLQNDVQPCIGDDLRDGAADGSAGGRAQQSGIALVQIDDAPLRIRNHKVWEGLQRALHQFIHGEHPPF